MSGEKKKLFQNLCQLEQELAAPLKFRPLKEFALVKEEVKEMEHPWTGSSFQKKLDSIRNDSASDFSFSSSSSSASGGSAFRQLLDASENLRFASD